MRRPKKDLDVDPEERPAAPDPEQILEDQLRALLEEGVTHLSELTERVTEGLGDGERFVAAGRIAKVLARLTRPLSGGERPWVRVDQNLAIEQWRLPEKRSV